MTEKWSDKVNSRMEGMYRGSVVEMKVSLLHTLSMVSLRVRQTEQSFLEKITVGGMVSKSIERRVGGRLKEFKNILLPVPKRKRNVLQTMSVGNTGNAVFTPAKGSGTSVVVREVWPGIARQNENWPEIR